MSAIGKLFEIEQLPLEKRKQLYEKFLQKYTTKKKKNPLKEIRAEVWNKTKDKGILARLAMLTSKISISERLKEGHTEIDVYYEIGKLIQNKNFLNGIGTKGKPIENIVTNEIKKAVSSFTSS